ncbi:MAG: 16S rRNA (cytidine(1402)-2'-O)-methyltransferase [Mariprofundales bacterium]
MNHNDFNSYGQLFVVATPIGNMEDISNRALRILAEVDIIAAEDTRTSSKLLRHYSITTPLIAYHEHNEKQRCASLVHSLQSGKSLALISDAGTPLINDPGYCLLQAAIQAGIKIIPIAGACSPIAALSASGLPTHAFTFCGFVPRSGKLRYNFLQTIQEADITTIALESPQRLLATLSDLANVFKNKDDKNNNTAPCPTGRLLCVARELSKVYESFIRGDAVTILAHFEQHPDQLRGEIVLIIAPRLHTEIDDAQILKALAKFSDLSPSKRASLVAAQLSLPKKQVYRLIS